MTDTSEIVATLGSELRAYVEEVQQRHDAPGKNQFHTNLWDPQAAPNGNRITTVWEDGEVTDEKGGFAFGERSLFTLRGPVPNAYALKNIQGGFLPMKRNGFQMLICTEAEAFEIREKMAQLAQAVITHIRHL